MPTASHPAGLVIVVPAVTGKTFMHCECADDHHPRGDPIHHQAGVPLALTPTQARLWHLFELMRLQGLDRLLVPDDLLLQRTH